ncbi:hypothetical protein V2A60_003488 [Cordyceps javanica]
MAYRYTLPAQRSPYSYRQRETALRSQTISNAIARSPGLKRTSLNVHGSTTSRDASLSHPPWAEELDKENIKLTTYPVLSANVFEEDCQYDPADPTTWGIRPLPPLPYSNGSDLDRTASITSKSDDDAAMLQSPVLPPCTEPATASKNLAQIIGDHLRIDDEHPNSTQRRTTSSSYHQPESEPSRVQSPTPNGNVNMLSVTNLAKYGKTNDRLSNLRSGSPSSATGEVGSDPHDDSSSTVND